MVVWPSDYNGAWTLAGPVSRAGVGLHSGDSVSVTLLPSEKPGFFVSWHDAPQRAPVRLAPSQVRDSQLCTTLDLGDRHLATVEHLLAALAGTGITHAELRMRGGEGCQKSRRGGGDAAAGERTGAPRAARAAAAARAGCRPHGVMATPFASGRTRIL